MNTGRIWTIALWSLVLASIAGGGDAAFVYLQKRAAARPVLLLPRETINEPKRNQLMTDLRARKEVAEGRWLSPSMLAQETAQSISRDQWPDLFPEESAWMPWVAELRLHDPLLEHKVVPFVIQSLRSDSTWRLVMWDDAQLKKDWDLLTRTATLAGIAALLVFALGIQALRVGQARTISYWAEGGASAALALTLLAILLLAAWRVGVTVDRRLCLVTLGSGFALAGVLAPMIKGRRAVFDKPAAEAGKHGGKNSH